MAHEASIKVEIPSRLEELWELSPHLPSPQRLNAAFDSIAVSSFPPLGEAKVIEIASDASIAEAVQILARNNVLSAPVRDVEAPDDASWIDRYIGIVEFAGIILWLLQQSGVSSPKASAKLENLQAAALASSGSFGRTAVPEPYPPEILESDFFEELTSSSCYNQSKVKDIVGSFRWAPFLPVQKSDTLLTVLLLLSNYHMKSLPVVESGRAEIQGLITQSAVVHVLSQCIGIPWFDSLGKLSLAQLGLPSTTSAKMLKIVEDEPVLRAFRVMRYHNVGGLPVITKSDNKPIGNISIRDVRFLLTAPQVYKSHRTITAKDFLQVTKSILQKDQPSSPILHPVIVCTSSERLQDVISKLDRARIHRIYVVDKHGHLEGVVTLRDIISKFVDEPPGYFGDFFAGVVPATRTCKV
ncbi:SNF1-related protein kinase regulatory subunit gamma-1 [Selaginella moellendorffii]|uniref:SNF1-related protein kinase regulatory subunit gamma-1 n=1 Tax=Selaginella moellendorffii TaxID=88036 RepID=UPI000D1CABD6|nr:SNF1-related protein kinase regulatory subunit gamma-1 [Selaginella moellendorffii]|eukprot:XP_024532234.1 SNF1-related protein kinase regulatory subunit gamma-1 [Selaginella moellendorffii]